MNVEEIIPEEIICNCCLTNENVEICKLENCDYPLCNKCFEKVPDICPKCRRKIKESKVIEVEIDLDELESIQEIYRERIFCRCCCMWISINDREEMESVHYICDCGKIREYWNAFMDVMIQVSIAILISAAVATGIAIIILLGRLVTYLFQIGCYDYWCKMVNENTGEETYCLECFIGWGLLGAVMGFFILCLSAGVCCGKSEDDC